MTVNPANGSWVTEPKILFNLMWTWNNKLGQSLLIPCSSSDARMLLFNVNFSACKLIIDSNLRNKKWCPFFYYEDFYLKTSFVSALGTVVIFFSLAVSTVVLFTCVFSKPVMVHSKKKKLWTCTFASFVLNVIVFLYNGLKQSFILFGKNQVIALYGNSSKHVKRL